MFVLCCVLAFCLSLYCSSARAQAADDDLPVEDPVMQAHVHWLSLEPGLEAADISLGREHHLSVLRIDPAHFNFVLCASSQHGVPRSLARWSTDFDLVAAINAGMYLPDGRTNVGYLREGRHINNKRVSQRPGAFFVAGPDGPDLPSVAILEREDPRWQQLDRFRLVIQNYRMISGQRQILWQADGPPSAIAAVGEDGQGHILFLYCPQDMDPYRFCRWLLDLPLDVRTVMYVEGGSQAGLSLRCAQAQRDLGGTVSSFLQGLVQKAQLPNVLGIKRKTGVME